jgi:hypothetical protein
MADREDQQAIDGLFNRIEDVARNSPPRDRDAEGLIQQRLREFPPAPYYMAQTIIIQEQALQQAQARIAELESRQTQGGFLGGLFGDTAQQRRPEPSRAGPWGSPPDDNRRRQGGSGFLAGAAQTALGVTGGMLLGSAIAGMLTGTAQADETAAGAEPDQEFDGGDGFADDGFDIGGDF